MTNNLSEFEMSFLHKNHFEADIGPNFANSLMISQFLRQV